MHQYRYEAAATDGAVVKGVVTAPDLVTARDDVESRRLQPLKVLEVPDEAPAAPRAPVLTWR